MERREFLKLLGLGGVALTLPKPLAVVAARMADLEAPPLHVGRAELTLEPGNYLGYIVYGFAFDIERGLARDAWEDFVGHWALRIARRDAAGNLTDILRTAVKNVPSRPGPDAELGWCGSLLSAMSPKRPFFLPSPMLLRPGETWEWWLRPYGARRPLPRVDLVIAGHMDRPSGEGLVPTIEQTYSCLRFDRVRVDRAAAIRMGLAGPEEPEEDFSRPEEGREVIRCR